MIIKQYIKDFEKLGFGMFVHFGPYSVYGHGEWAKSCLKITNAPCVALVPSTLKKKLNNLKGTSKNYPFAIWAHLLPQLFAAKIPQYTKYSGISATQFGTKSAAQIIKK